MSAGRPLIGEARAPGDKSVTQRALLIGAVAAGTTEARGALRAGDTASTAACVRALGARVEWSAGGTLRVTGADRLASPGAALDCGNSATAARLLLGLLAGRPGAWTLDGDASLRGRPMGRVSAPLRTAGARIEPAGAGSGDRLPLRVTGAPLAEARHEVALPSAQVKSALLLSGLASEGPVTVVQHVPTRDHTERMLPRFGVRLERAPGTVTVHPGRPRAVSLAVPGDPSAAAFLLVAAALVPGSDVWVRGVGLWPRRTGFLDALQRAGADVMVLARPPDADDRGAEVAARRPRHADADPLGDVRAGGSALRAFEIAPGQVPDLVDEIPVLALAAARAEGRSRFAGLGELRLKESDRVAATAGLLDALGVPVAVDGDTLTIDGTRRLRPPSRRLDLSDHRVALTAAVAARIEGWPPPPIPSAAVSFPGFAETLAALG